MEYEELKIKMLFSGLYQNIPLNESAYADLEKLLFSDFAFDSYCIGCSADSVFKVKEKAKNKPAIVSVNVFDDAIYDADEKDGLSAPRVAVVSKLAERYPYIRIDAVCSRCGEIMKFYYRLFSDSIQKIGQYPSVATLDKGALNKYRRILDADYNEFSKAIGLYAHGIGIGAYVYLRRIIERLIEEAHQKKKTTVGWDEISYQKSHAGERIDALSDVIDNDTIQLLKPSYSILSKGIHELEERECQEHFLILQTAIELILDEKLAKLDKEYKIKKTQSDLGTIKGELS